MPSTTRYSYLDLQKVRNPAARHQGANGECTYFELSEHSTILLILSVIMSSFQIILENPTGCDKIKFAGIIITRLNNIVNMRGVRNGSDIFL